MTGLTGSDEANDGQNAESQDIQNDQNCGDTRPVNPLDAMIADFDPAGSIRASWERGSSKSAGGSTGSPAPLQEFSGELPPVAKRVERARKYLARVESAVQGQQGSNPTFTAARALIHGFCLDEETALGLLLSEYNPRCTPPWSIRELQHKINQAATKPCRKPRGWLLVPRGKYGVGASRASHASHASAGNVPFPPASTAPAPGPAAPQQASSTQGGTVEVSATPENVFSANETITNPQRLARTVLERYRHHGTPTLVYWQDGFHVWDGKSYQTKPEKSFRARVWGAVAQNIKQLHLEEVKNVIDGPVPKLPDVTTSLVANVIGAIQADTICDTVDASPAWINGETGPDPRELVPAQNGLVHLPRYAAGMADAVIPNSPNYLNFNAVCFAADPDSPRPKEWLKFLENLWEHDPDSILLLQEWFGYLLCPETRSQKMFLMIGPPRSGKGTINRVLQLLVGTENCATPALGGDDGIGGRFGLQSLLQKSVAIVEDARIPRGPATTTAIARMLTISGEGCITVDRKNSYALPRVRLYTRFVIASNEMPDLPDASTALARRWSILRMTKSYFGQEDTELAGRLVSELPGIFNWAVEGWNRLRNNGWRFTVPESSQREIDELIDLSSPVTEFLREKCEIGPDHCTPCKDVYDVWRQWCEESGRREPGTAAQFGRILAAADSATKRVKRRIHGKLTWCYPLSLVADNYEECQFPWERSTAGVPGAVPGVPGAVPGKYADPGTVIKPLLGDTCGYISSPVPGVPGKTRVESIKEDNGNKRYTEENNPDHTGYTGYTGYTRLKTSDFCDAPPGTVPGTAPGTPQFEEGDL